MDASLLPPVTLEVAHAPSPRADLVAGHVGPAVAQASAVPARKRQGNVVVPGGNPTAPAAKARAPGANVVVRSRPTAEKVTKAAGVRGRGFWLLHPLSPSRKEMPRRCRSTVSLPRKRGVRRNGRKMALCGACGAGDGDEELRLCDICDRGRHTFCLRPGSAPTMPRPPSSMRPSATQSRRGLEGDELHGARVRLRMRLSPFPLSVDTSTGLEFGGEARNSRWGGDESGRRGGWGRDGVNVQRTEAGARNKRRAMPF
uniref:Uncharacterized protein 259I16.3 n=1 Tax=Hordeum vulgare subsp. vulgare TaxID=112509 RepID=Q8SA51_HORVV|nr:hypothetical protein [Hordeum vulgare subsp. vulgare]